MVNNGFQDINFKISSAAKLLLQTST